MKSKFNSDHIVYTNKALCRDCNRCVRVCPVNAIKIQDSQAQVISEKCIDCGACVLECPQGAKTYTSYIHLVETFLKEGSKVIATLAPSMVSAYDKWQLKRLPSALRLAGFEIIAETATGAYFTASETRNYIVNNPEKSHICSSCPVVVSYVEKYATELVSNLVPVVSPLIAHARILKQKYPNYKIVFIGPCIAKLKEIQRPEFAGLVDAGITFEQLNTYLEEKNIHLENCEESEFDDSPQGESRLFPLEGGLLKTAELSTDIINNNYISISGAKNVQQALSFVGNNKDSTVIEPLYCKHGCINGPAISKRKINPLEEKYKLIEHNNAKNHLENSGLKDIPSLSTRFTGESRLSKKTYTEKQIQEVLIKTGKNDKDTLLNCGGCGYDTCRDKAIAVLDGIAEVEMCIPYMRRLAEKRSHLIIERDPNGLVILDSKLCIRHMNPAFKKMFLCSDKIIGQHISYLMDAMPFEKLISDPEEIIRDEVKFTNYSLICHQFCYSVPEEQKYIGVFIDITELRNKSNELSEIKTDTILKAHELIEHQIEMAQLQAKFLGESTAKGEVLLQRLIDAIQ